MDVLVVSAKNSSIYGGNSSFAVAFCPPDSKLVEAGQSGLPFCLPCPVANGVSSHASGGHAWSGGRSRDCVTCKDVTCAASSTLTWVGPSVADMTASGNNYTGGSNITVSTGDVVQVSVCASSANSAPVCDAAYVAIDDTAPIMSWTKDALPVNTAYRAYNALHPYTSGIINDISHQV
jgi:hypothetical protein